MGWLLACALGLVAECWLIIVLGRQAIGRDEREAADERPAADAPGPAGDGP